MNLQPWGSSMYYMNHKDSIEYLYYYINRMLREFYSQYRTDTDLIESLLQKDLKRLHKALNLSQVDHSNKSLEKQEVLRIKVKNKISKEIGEIISNLIKIMIIYEINPKLCVKNTAIEIKKYLDKYDRIKSIPNDEKRLRSLKHLRENENEKVNNWNNDGGIFIR